MISRSDLPEPENPEKVITHESEVQELCEAVDLTVQAVEVGPGGVIIATISPTRTHWKTLNNQLYRAMQERGTRWYSVVHHTMLGQPYSELWFTAL